MGPRSGIYLFLLILFGVFFADIASASAQACEGIFADSSSEAVSKTLTADALYRGIQQIHAKQGTRTVIAYQYLKPRGLDSVFLSSKAIIILRGDHDLASLILSFNHEAGHSTTLHRLRTQPQNPENILALTVFRMGTPIDLLLLPTYQQGYQADEMKTHLRSSALAAQIERDVVSPPHTSSALRNQSGNFAKVTYRLLSELEGNLTVANHSFPLQYKIEPYGSGTSDVYRVTVTLLQLQGPPILLHFPIYARDKFLLREPALRQHLIELCRQGKAIAQQYL